MFDVRPRFVAYFRLYHGRGRARADHERMQNAQRSAMKEFVGDGELLEGDEFLDFDVPRNSPDRPGLRKAARACTVHKARLIYVNMGHHFRDQIIEQILNEPEFRHLDVVQAETKSFARFLRSQQRQKVGWSDAARMTSAHVRRERSTQEFERAWKIIRWLRWSENEALQRFVEKANSLRVVLKEDGNLAKGGEDFIPWTPDSVIRLLLAQMKESGRGKSARGLEKINLDQDKSLRKVVRVLDLKKVKTRTGQVGNWDANKVMQVVRYGRRKDKE